MLAVLQGWAAASLPTDSSAGASLRRIMLRCLLETGLARRPSGGFQLAAVQTGLLGSNVTDALAASAPALRTLHGSAGHRVRELVSSLQEAAILAGTVRIDSTTYESVQAGWLQQAVAATLAAAAGTTQLARSGSSTSSGGSWIDGSSSNYSGDGDTSWSDSSSHASEEGWEQGEDPCSGRHVACTLRPTLTPCRVLCAFAPQCLHRSLCTWLDPAMLWRWRCIGGQRRSCRATTAPALACSAPCCVVCWSTAWHSAAAEATSCGPCQGKTLTWQSKRRWRRRRLQCASCTARPATSCATCCGACRRRASLQTTCLSAPTLT